ncbi:predicted protein [Pyrenophora tritici-repentis Pt-1C-BFP]|uniref:Uncharacterized protein n=1 Tax=Pyrenophora tritici-repentis (strain Pt-1C-BFP) TaxID=426418 RepID=B2W8A8_PYRTR|nr:uncharacterized protein PTRG_06216 [Pyrenophora tritici-repentis Pt-1C-BFP]EDU49136.1 predicted protein [Pyrenophora tritici-repentis Pt-1C-BFP]
MCGSIKVQRLRNLTLPRQAHTRWKTGGVHKAETASACRFVRHTDFPHREIEVSLYG